jgi:hypothetical protein
MIRRSAVWPAKKDAGKEKKLKTSFGREHLNFARFNR